MVADDGTGQTSGVRALVQGYENNNHEEDSAGTTSTPSSQETPLYPSPMLGSMFSSPSSVPPVSPSSASLIGRVLAGTLSPSYCSPKDRALLSTLMSILESNDKEMLASKQVEEDQKRQREVKRAEENEVHRIQQERMKSLQNRLLEVERVNSEQSDALVRQKQQLELQVKESEELRRQQEEFRKEEAARKEREELLAKQEGERREREEKEKRQREEEQRNIAAQDKASPLSTTRDVKIDDEAVDRGWDHLDQILGKEASVADHGGIVDDELLGVPEQQNKDDRIKGRNYILYTCKLPLRDGP
tara:strand:- start:107 stop:1015 length:909 start_codon:yes stop_codon:yes gene_type:complete